ncbi:uncharacterized protein LOC125048908 [Pieris napi]|uniref:uncharacterized protein LOC125048908 n=1 Tax=Pieris napi TaxID=78633 RepID=UPI001FBB7C26|nr:uncharacterized protein LOC125048908 [Pieris napi]
MNYLWLLTLLIPFISTAVSDGPSSNGCGELGDCITSPDNCDKKCGCDTYSLVLVFNETTQECELNIQQFLHTLQEKDDIHEKIIAEAENVFKRIILSVIIVAACSVLCVFSACFYCCRINYLDNRLKKDVDAMAAKLKREKRYKKIKSEPIPEKAESCNIIVGNAGVYCV